MDTLSFGSFPRSGNHFCYELIKQTLPKTNLIYLEHRIDPIDKETNVFTTIRTPLECVPSWITFTADFRENRAEQVLEWYCAYYKKCQESKVLVIPFTQLISHPLDSVHKICMYHKIEQPTVETIEFDFSSGFHVPTKDKSGYVTIINEMKNAPSFEPAMKLFEALCVPVG